MKFMLLALLNISLLAPLGAIDKPAAEGEALWQPEVGDFWVYEVVVEIPAEAKITYEAEAEAGVEDQAEDKAEDKAEDRAEDKAEDKAEDRAEDQAETEDKGSKKIQGKVKAVYKQTSICRGLMPIGKDGAQAHAFYLSNEGELESIQYLAISDDRVGSMATKQEGKAPQPPNILSKPIPLMQSDWKGGESFSFEMNRLVGGKKVHYTRKFRIIGWETIETKAGKFRAMQVQITGMNGSIEITQHYWFAPGTGFIKEVRKYYIANELGRTETKVLEQFGKQGSKQESEREQKQE